MNPIQSAMCHDSVATRSRHMRRALLLALISFLHPTPLSVAVTFVAPEWKAHFKGRLVIEHCVFERTAFLQGGATNLNHVWYQENAFLMREIGRTEDAALNHIAGRNSYAGHFDGNYWAIEGGRVLKLFPNSEVMIRELRNPGVSYFHRCALGRLS
jgi:hypothetical protein